MRLLHTFNNPKTAHVFSDFLKGEGIDNECDINANADWGSHEYGNIEGKIWIIEEDLTPKAEQWLAKFLENPSDPLFYENVKAGGPLLAPAKEFLKRAPRRLMESGLPSRPPRSGPITLAIMLACIFIFMIEIGRAHV